LLQNIGKKPACEMLMKLTSGVNLQTFYKQFLTATSSPKKDFYTPPTPQKCATDFVLHTQNSAAFVLRIQKAPKKQAQKSWQKGSKKGGKKGRQKKQQERQKKSLFLNLSCCCLENSLKPVLVLA